MPAVISLGLVLPDEQLDALEQRVVGDVLLDDLRRPPATTSTVLAVDSLKTSRATALSPFEVAAERDGRLLVADLGDVPEAQTLVVDRPGLDLLELSRSAPSARAV